MSNRLDKDREHTVGSARIASTATKLKEMGYDLVISNKQIRFEHNGNTVTFYPYSGWHTGKGITDGRGFNKLLKQLK